MAGPYCLSLQLDSRAKRSHRHTFLMWISPGRCARRIREFYPLPLDPQRGDAVIATFAHQVVALQRGVLYCWDRLSVRHCWPGIRMPIAGWPVSYDGCTRAQQSRLCRQAPTRVSRFSFF